ncbi:MAG: type II secretion system F family protein [Planctomycetota bacterium]|jgi:general secretion pathway protein F
MPTYTYKAKNAGGEPVTGLLQAESEKAALDTLHRQGVFPLEIRGRGDNGSNVAGEGAAERRSFTARRRPRAGDIAIFTRQLADLLRAGISLHRALTTLQRQTSNVELARVIGEVAREVSAGKALNEALAKHSNVFSALFVSLVRAGETGGFLEDVLRRLADFIEKDAELRSRVLSALAYPILLLCLGTIAIVVLMIFFIPTFSNVFDELGATLPTATRIVMAISFFIRDYWAIPLAAVVLITLLLQRAYHSTAGRRIFDRVKISLPLFGTVVRRSSIARFTRTLGTLLRSGVPILTALQVSREALGNQVLMEDVEDAGMGVTQGRSLADMLKRTRTFPPMVVDMVAVGEESGNLDEVLINIAESYDRQVDRAVRVFVSLFEPLLLVFMAAIVGFIVVSMLLPVFTLSGQIVR